MDLFTILEAYLIESASKLDHLSRVAQTEEEKIRLRGKREGVNLALSKLLELIRY